MYEHNALGDWLGLALCLTKVRSSRARCPATALIINVHTNCFYHDNADFQGWYLIIQYQIDRVPSIEGFSMDSIVILSHKFEWL